MSADRTMTDEELAELVSYRHDTLMGAESEGSMRMDLAEFDALLARMRRGEELLARIIAANDDYLEANPVAEDDPLTLEIKDAAAHLSTLKGEPAP